MASKNNAASMDTKTIYEKSSFSSILTFNIDSPMHPSTRPNTPPAPQPNPNNKIKKCTEEQPASPKKCKANRIKNMIKGNLLFLLTTIVLGFFYIGTQAVAALGTGKSEDHTFNVRWWFSVDAIELMFYFFVLSATMHFVINAGGGSTCNDKLHWSLIVPVVLTTISILIGVAPISYQQVNTIKVPVMFDRGGCFTNEEVNTKFSTFTDTCPLIPKNRFIRFDFENRTEVDIRAITNGLSLLQGVMAMLKTFSEPKLHSFVGDTCLFKLFDLFCGDMFREVGVHFMVVAILPMHR